MSVTIPDTHGKVDSPVSKQGAGPLIAPLAGSKARSSQEPAVKVDQEPAVKVGISKPAPSDKLPADDVPTAKEAPAPVVAEAPAPRPDPYAGLDLPEIDPSYGNLPKSDANTWAVMGAAWRAETIRTDAWEENDKRRKALAQQMYRLLPEDAKTRVDTKMGDYLDQTSFEMLVLSEVQHQRDQNPGPWAAFPTTAEEFTATIDKARRSDLDEAQAVLDQPGGGVAEFLATAGRDFTDQASLAMLPLGGFEGAAWKRISSEMLLGAVGNTITIPRENKVAEDLGLAKPDPWMRAIEGAALGGVFAGAVLGAGKALNLWASRRGALRTALPKGADPLSAELSVDKAEANMLGDQTPQEFVAGQKDQTPGGPITFDFSAAGNASPRDNRIGYVYGRLMEKGMTPEQAAGFVGNFMQESGPSLNPGAVGDGGAALGIAQWNSRGPALRAFAAKAGKDWHDLDTQIDFLFHELEGSEAAAWARIKGARTPEEAALAVSQFFERPGVPHNERRVAFAKSIADQYQAGKVPKWEGANLAPDGPIPPITTSRSFTREGQVTAGDTRVNVRYEVVDAATLRPATAELQPRDRSTQASDAQIAKIAAELDPIRLMPSPEAQNGAPIVGPDHIVESGNGRVAALNRAFDLHPDRAATYVQALKDAGYDVPEGMARPVLVARRVDEMTPPERVGWVKSANIAQIARLTPDEMARLIGSSLTAADLGRLDPKLGLSHAGNAGFVDAVLARIPAEERNALGRDGKLSAHGSRLIREAVFAAAWNDPILFRLYMEEDRGSLGALITGLERAAPAWAALKSDIRAGLVAPEMDISGHVTEAMRLIASARDMAGQTEAGMAGAIDELLADVDLLEGAVSPLTARLVKEFWADGKAAKADAIADFLRRYADDARKGGATGGLVAPLRPGDVLAQIDPETFGDLPADYGRPRGAEAPPAEPTSPAPGMEIFDKGADAPEVIEADKAAALELVPEMRVDKAAPKAAEPARSQSFTPPAPRTADLMAALDAQFADLSFDLPDGTSVSAREIIDDLKSDEGFDAFIQACALPTGGAQ